MTSRTTWSISMRISGRRAFSSSSDIGGLPVRFRFEGVPCWLHIAVNVSLRPFEDRSGALSLFASSSIWRVHVMKQPAHPFVPGGFSVPHSTCRITGSLLLHSRIFRAMMTSRNLTMTFDGGRGRRTVDDVAEVRCPPLFTTPRHANPPPPRRPPPVRQAPLLSAHNDGGEAALTYPYSRVHTHPRTPIRTVRDDAVPKLVSELPACGGDPSSLRSGEPLGLSRIAGLDGAAIGGGGGFCQWSVQGGRRAGGRAGGLAGRNADGRTGGRAGRAVHPH